MAGIYVSRDVIDQKIGYALINLRSAFDQIEHVNQFLVNNPVPAPPGVDPLTAAPFNYTADEAYAMRLVFQNFATEYTNLAANFTTASKFTGLE